MSVEEAEENRRLQGIFDGIEAWIAEGNARKLERWIDRELDSEGTPLRLSPPNWLVCLEALADARRRRNGWPSSIDSRIEGLLIAFLRFSRPNGTPAAQTGDGSPDLNPRSILRDWVKIYPSSGAARVIGWWFPKVDAAHVPPPLPAWTSKKGLLAILRADWLKQGDFLVVDHREPESGCRFELFGAGRTWLGPTWEAIPCGKLKSRPRPGLWHSNSSADLAEWSFRGEGPRVTRTALLLRGRGLALLGDQFEGATTAPPENRVVHYAIPPSVTTGPIPDSRGLLLKTASGKATAQVLPIGLPSLPYETERGRFQALERELVLTQAATGRRSWLPLLVSWDPKRNRKKVHWRGLTVSERSRVCPANVAFAVRVSWGRDETLVIYRSLAPPALRAFLGHQTRARFLVGRFTRDGAVQPILSLD